MYYKEKTFVVKALDSAIDSLSRAEATIRRSEVCTTADMNLAKDMYDKAKEVREIRNTIRTIYKQEDL